MPLLPPTLPNFWIDTNIRQETAAKMRNALACTFPLNKIPDDLIVQLEQLEALEEKLIASRLDFCNAVATAAKAARDLDTPPTER